MKRSSRPDLEPRRKSSTLHYQTFPTKPPTSRGAPPSPEPSLGHRRGDSDASAQHHESPLPKAQLAMLAVIALAEQTALNSISPYLPEMTTTFPGVTEDKVGIYVGLIASSFALAQFGTNFFWGWLSDRIGRKPVVLTGTLLTTACFIAFGFCKTLWQAIVVQIFMGLVNGNQGVISTCLGEITDRSNQSRAFTYLPVVYGIGGITGPIVGGLLVFKKNPFTGNETRYPYLAPNLFAAAILFVDMVLTMLFLEESLEEARDLPPLGKRMENLFSWLWQFTSPSRSPTYIRRMVGKHRRTSSSSTRSHSEGADDASDVSQDSAPTLLPNVSNGENLSRREVLNRDTLLLLLTFLIFQFANISYNSLYPIFAQAPPPTGRSLSTEEIGVSLAFAGAITILFQIGIYGKLREKMGNKSTYRVSLAAFVVAFLLMPWVGYKDGGNMGSGLGRGKTVMWIELGFVLIVKTVAAVGGLTSALLLVRILSGCRAARHILEGDGQLTLSQITNSAPDHAVLGTLNGLAQTLSAAGRAVGPFVSGSLFSAATRLRPKGEAMAFGVFGGITFVGFLLSFGIRGASLESEGFDEEEGSEADEDADDEDEGQDSISNERTELLGRK